MGTLGREEEEDFPTKKMTKQLTSKRDDKPLHSAAREGRTEFVLGIIDGCESQRLKELLADQNQSGETALYVAAEYGYVEMVKEMMKYYDVGLAGIKARNGYDAFHIAAKQGNLKILEVLMETNHQLSMTLDKSNTTALHSAASQGHAEIVQFLLENAAGLASIARSNGKTALHSAARNGHLDIVIKLASKDIGIVTRTDKKGQTALHMAVKGQNAELVNELANSDPSLINMIDSKGNSAMHIAVRKGRKQIVLKLLDQSEICKNAVNKAGETALDTAEKTGKSEIADILKRNGFKLAKSVKSATIPPSARELKQTVSEIEHEVHSQLKETHQTKKKRGRGISQRVDKMHTEGLNNAINSTTVVAILIATVAFAAIFTVPGQFYDDPKDLPPNSYLGEARIAPRPEFLIFVVFDAVALFISLAVVVVQTSVVVIERKAKKQMMAVINKLMWLACVLISIAFLALSYVVVGDDHKSLAIAITGIGTVIMVSTLGTMCYWVVANRLEVSRLRSIRRSSISRSQSFPVSVMSDEEIYSEEYNKKLYAV